MSEQLLKAIIQLYALISRLDGMGEKERSRMKKLLAARLKIEDFPRYVQLFEVLVKEDITSKSDDPELERITEISRKIGKELTKQQRVVMISELIQLTLADNILTDRENQALENIGRELNIDSGDLHAIQSFVAASTLKDFESSNVLIIKKDRYSVSKNCHYIKPDGELDGYIAILKLETIQPFFLRYSGKSTIFLNQIPVEYGAMEIVPAGSTIRGDRFQAIYYSDIFSRYSAVEQEHELHLIAENISFKFKDETYGIKNISLDENSGRLVGIMGASGSGKSTLINVLNGNEVPSEGYVTVNGIDIHKNQKAVEGLIGYVPQENLLIEDLTVYQNLYYAAKLCFKDYNKEEIHDLVDKTLINLGLYDIRDLKVGGPLQKVISGGQIKRLNIGLELLREPMILFVDEPTSGLSSRDSENIMDLLKELSIRGKLVFVVIHQPSSDIFKMFDRLVVLDMGGLPIYYGNPLEVVGYFRKLSQHIDKQQEACPVCGTINTEQIFNIIEARVVDEYGHPTSRRKVTAETWNNVYLRNAGSAKPVEKKEHVNIPASRLNIPGKLRQFRIFAHRDLKSKLANRMYVLINLMEAPLLAFILAIFVRFYPQDGFLPTEYVFQDNINIPSYIFMAVVVALFIGLTVSAEEIIRDRKVVKRESFLHLSKGSYLASKILILFSLSFIQMATFVLIGNLILEIRDMNMIYFFVLFSAACFANVLGLNISSAFNSAITIYILIPLILIPQILLSGVVVQFDQLNPWFGSKSSVPLAGDVMASRWSYEALMVSQFKDNKFETMFYSTDRDIANTDFKTSYYIPRLKTMIDYLYVNQGSADPKREKTMERYGVIVKNELEKQLTYVGRSDYLDHNTDLRKLDSLEYKNLHHLMDVLKRLYMMQNKKAKAQKDSIINIMTRTPADADAFNAMKRNYTNDQINTVVFDNREVTRILEHKGQLIQQIYPIYTTPDPDHLFDYRTLFFAPEKYFAGHYFDTLYFNVGVLWFMTVMLVVMLYFDVLRRLVSVDNRVFNKLNIRKSSKK